MRRLLVSLTVLAGGLPAQNEFTSPAGLEQVDGSGSHDYVLFARPGMRWQQIDATHRGQAYANISSIAWRRDAAAAASPASTARTLTGMRVFLADAALVGIGRDFDANYRNPATEVFTPKDVNLPDWVSSSSRSPEPWSVVLPLDVPWSYTGSHDLLWEVRYAANSAVPAGTSSANYRTDFEATSGSFTTSTNGVSSGDSGCTATGRSLPFALGGTLYNHGNKFRYTQSVRGAPSTTPVVVNLGLVDPDQTVAGLCQALRSDALLSYVLGVSSPTGSVSTRTFDDLPYASAAVGVSLFFQAVSLDPGQQGVPGVLSDGRRYTVPADPGLPGVGRVYEYPRSNGSLVQSGPWTGGLVARFVY